MNPRLFSLQPGADSIKKLGALLVFGACGLFCPLSGSAAAPSQPDALTAASFSSDFPAEHMPLKVGVVKYVRPSPYEPIVEATIGALKRVFGTSNVIVTHYDLAGLSQAIREGEVDLFLSSSGFYVRMERYGARAAATVASNNYPNPNHNDGSTIVVSAARKSLNKLSDLKGAKLVLSSPQAFTGRQLAEHVLLKAGLNPETLFSSRVYLGDGKRLEGAIPMILSGEADVGFFRLCYLEEWLASHPNAKGQLKVLNRLDSAERPEPCMRSTALYPSWTVATTPATDPRVSRLVLRTLFEMPPTFERGLYWSAATDYSSVDQVFHDLRIGPYAYLRDWTVRRLIDEYGTWILLFALLLLGLIFHSVRVSQLVRVRTAHLQEALHEQQRLQNDARAAAERVEHMSRVGAVGQLSTIFAHEMRQPLAAISLYVFGLKRLVQSGSMTPEKIEAIAGKLETQTARADAIVNRVRAYAKSDKPVREAVSLVEAARKALRELTTTGRWHAAVSIAAREDVQCLADPLELELVAMNLIKNALEAVEGLPAGMVNIAVSEHNGKAELTVLNNGPAVSSELVERLNDRAASGSSSKKSGLGLGLSIVRSILERLGGRITFTALAGGGLAAVATLPTLAQVHALVRIVDDEADLREALSFVLDMEGWKTVTYGRAEDFFTGDSPSEPGCVVLDVRMPGMSGIEAQHEMRSRGIALPIIFLTGHGDVDMAVGAVQDGAFDFLLKPVDNERFLNSVACAAWASAAAAAGLPGEDSLERLAALTKRERSLAELIALGLTNREAAERSGIAQRTMEVHRANILRKLGVKTPEDIRRLLEMAAAEKS